MNAYNDLKEKAAKVGELESRLVVQGEDLEKLGAELEKTHEEADDWKMKFGRADGLVLKLTPLEAEN
jgi:hypothetical protein